MLPSLYRAAALTLLCASFAVKAAPVAAPKEIGPQKSGLSSPGVTSDVNKTLSYADLAPKGFNLRLPPAADTLFGEAGGLRRNLADVGIGWMGMNLLNVAANTLSGSASSNNGVQQYNGQTPTYSNAFLFGLTYDLSRFGVPDGQLFVSVIRGNVSWAPLGPTRSNLSQATFYRTFLDKKLEMKAGWISNSWQFANSYVGGALASSVFGPSSNIPTQGGMSNNQTPTPGINLKYNFDGGWYAQVASQRSVNPDGIAAEATYNRRATDWTTPNAGTLYLYEYGFNQAAGKNNLQSWIRGGGGYNTSSYKSYENPGTRVDHNEFYYLVGDHQLTQFDAAGTPGRGVYAGLSVMYAPPESNVVSNYLEGRLYVKGPLDSRPYDMVSLVLTNTGWGKHIRDIKERAGNRVHDDSTALTLTYNARLIPGVYGAIGLGYVNHPTSVAYQRDTGSALNLLGSLNVFF